MNDLIERLRALSRYEHSDYSIGDEASYALEVARMENKGHRIAIQQLYDRAEALAEALQWYVDNDDTNDGQEGNEFWLAGRDRARALLRDQGVGNG